MKMYRLFPLILGLVAACAVPDARNAVHRTEVVFDHPEKFTDVKDAYMPTEKGRDAILADIRDFLVYQGDAVIPQGYRLKITFTDIDLAGDFEPWHGPLYEDVRFVKAIYPPAFKFTYAVTDPSGKVVREGSEDIRDLSFQLRVTLDSVDPLRYEKDILGEWVRSKLGDIAKACAPVAGVQGGMHRKRKRFGDSFW